MVKLRLQNSGVNLITYYFQTIRHSPVPPERREERDVRLLDRPRPHCS